MLFEILQILLISEDMFLRLFYKSEWTQGIRRTYLLAHLSSNEL